MRPPGDTERGWRHLGLDVRVEGHFTGAQAVWEAQLFIVDELGATQKLMSTGKSRHGLR